MRVVRVEGNLSTVRDALAVPPRRAPGRSAAAAAVQAVWAAGGGDQGDAEWVEIGASEAVAELQTSTPGAYPAGGATAPTDDAALPRRHLQSAAL